MHKLDTQSTDPKASIEKSLEKIAGVAERLSLLIDIFIFYLMVTIVLGIIGWLVEVSRESDKEHNRVNNTDIVTQKDPVIWESL